MENVLRKRVRSRIEARGLTAYGAAKLAGLNRYAVQDLIAPNPKKETLRQSALIKLASALECDPEYLAGTQTAIRRSK